MKHNDKIKPFDYSKLRGRIKEKLNHQYVLAEKIGISTNAFSRKLNNALDFTNRETAKIIEVLDIKGDEIKEYFLLKRLHETQQSKC